MYSFIDSKQPFYDCASLKMTLFLKKNLFFSFYLPFKISKFSILIKPTLWSVKVWSLKTLKNILFPISKKCVIIRCRSIAPGLKKKYPSEICRPGATDLQQIIVNVYYKILTMQSNKKATSSQSFHIFLLLL